MEPLKANLEKIIFKYFPKGSVHGLNNNPIPPKKLENVEALHNLKDEEVLFIYDATLFGSAKDGMVFTDSGIYWREILCSPESLDYRELIESTANKELKSKGIFILGQEEKFELKENYYKLICHLRSELIDSSIIYETYYKSALKSAEETLSKFLKNEQFRQIIGWLDQYEGLFLKPNHKSAKILEVLFEAYLEGKIFSKAQEQLDLIKDQNPSFYRKAAPLLEFAIKDEQYFNLEIRRLQAIEMQDYEEAYILFEEQRGLNILEEEDLNQKELEIKEAHFESLSAARAEAIEQEEYALAFSLLKDQDQLKIRQGFEMEKIRESVVKSKQTTLINYLDNFNRLLEEEQLLEAEQIVQQIYKIEALYPLEREKTLLTIYNYDFKKAKSEIAQISNLKLQLELEQALGKITKRLNEKIRNAARNKRYDIFESRPDFWTHKDEYAMSALSYFALEADIEGILRALEHETFLLMPANIFGHNFIDLIGFAYEPILGNRKDNLLNLLNKIQKKLDCKQINDRINFLKSGQEGCFFSYKLSQEERLAEMNEKLMSVNHFKHVLIEIDNQTNNHVDKIMKHLFSEELEDLDDYPEKEEFETAEAYTRRCKLFKKQYLDRADFIAEYKRQNLSMVESIMALLKDKKSCFIPKISALVAYKNKDLEALKSLKTAEGILALLELYFPAQEEVLTVELGIYDAEREVFLIKANDQVEEIAMPISIAKEFRQTFHQIEFVRRRIIKDGQVIWGTVPK
ncbi:MAG TPA: hypothetical protein GX707_19395 [Epulopiscium sp.]|nr:hypothetical protein [Candidatus Epulonipiscium sp.]